MMEQLGLFGDFDPSDKAVNQYGFPLEERRPIARESDPETSHDGARHVRPKLAGMRSVFMDVLRSIKRGTANEVAAGAVGAGLAKNAETVRKRARELVDLGWIRSIGVVVCSVTGQTAHQYEEVV